MLKKCDNEFANFKTFISVMSRRYLNRVATIAFQTCSSFVAILVFFALTLMPSHAAYSQNADEQQWWFDIEFIAFKRNLEPSNTEDFSQADFEMTQAKAIDLLSLAVLKQKAGLQAYINLVPSCSKKQNAATPFLSSLNIDSDAVKTAFDLSPLIPIEQTIETSDALVTQKSPVLLPTLFPFEKHPAMSMQVTCHLAKEQAKQSNILDEIVNTNSLVRHSSEILSSQHVSPIPSRVFSDRTYFNGQHHILPASETNLEELTKDVFRQRGIEPLLYTAWRQQVVFGEDAAPFYQIRAGEHFTLTPDIQNQPSEALLTQLALLDANASKNEDEHDNRAFFAKLETALANKASVDWLSQETTQENADTKEILAQSQWELDGLFKVYLDYVNRVPYLHIDSEFKHYKLSINESAQAMLSVYPFKQRRRIISKQIHYFDHPAFGIIVRLERFTPPKPIIDETINNSDIGNTNE